MQKIITTYIDATDGDRAMRQIMEAAGEGAWRIVSLTDLHHIQDEQQHSPGISEPHEGSLVLVVLEQA